MKQKKLFLGLFVVGIFLIGFLEYTNHGSLEIDDASFLILMSLMVIAITVSVHGMMSNYWIASILGALICFLPIFISLLISPGKFGFSLAVPGLLIYFVCVYLSALLIGLPVQKLKR